MQAARGDVNDDIVANRGVLANANLIDIAAQNSTIPNGRIRSDRNVANERCIGRHKGKITYLRSFVLIRSQSSVS
jgi:hypothetical protein